jgi:hypothetical protein
MKDYLKKKNIFKEWKTVYLIGLKTESSIEVG